MENSKASCSWCCSSRSGPESHQWLLSTMSGFSQSYALWLLFGMQKNMELQSRVEDLYRSYRSLAEYWERNGDAKIEPHHLNHESRIRYRLADFLTDDCRQQDNQLNVTEEAEKIKSRDNELESGLDMAGSVEQRISCSEQVMSFAKDVLGELTRRNDEKREANRVLRCQVGKMMEESRALRLEYDRIVSENEALHLKLNSLTEDAKNLQSCSRCSSIKKQRSSHLSRFKSMFF